MVFFHWSFFLVKDDLWKFTVDCLLFRFLQNFNFWIGTMLHTGVKVKVTRIEEMITN